MAVCCAWAVLPLVSLSEALKVIVPSFNPLRFSPLTVHVPPVPTVAVTAAVVVVPSVTVIDTVEPACRCR